MLNLIWVSITGTPHAVVGNPRQQFFPKQNPNALSQLNIILSKKESWIKKQIFNKSLFTVILRYNRCWHPDNSSRGKF